MPTPTGSPAPIQATTRRPILTPMRAVCPGECDHCGAEIRQRDPIAVIGPLSPFRDYVACRDCRGLSEIIELALDWRVAAQREWERAS